MDIRTVQFALHVFLETKRAENSSPYVHGRILPTQDNKPARLDEGAGQGSTG